MFPLLNNQVVAIDVPDTKTSATNLRDLVQNYRCLWIIKLIALITIVPSLVTNKGKDHSADNLISAKNVSAYRAFKTTTQIGNE